jgi:hypothetical protein
MKFLMYRIGVKDDQGDILTQEAVTEYFRKTKKPHFIVRIFRKLFKIENYWET